MHEEAPSRVKDGDAMLSLAAFTMTVERLQGPLYAFLRGLAGDTEQARDLTQDAFHDAWRATQRGDSPWTAADEEGGEEARRRWLFHTAYWRAISALRRRKIIHWLPLEWPWPARDGAPGPDGPSPGAPDLPDEAAAFEERIVEGAALRAALAKLVPEDAAALLLSVEGFSAAEAAAIMRVTPAALAQRVSRARRRLRAIYFAQNPPERDRRDASGSETE
jgi:RNA polymerase sigma-70 factor (ECF subfamily)